MNYVTSVDLKDIFASEESQLVWKLLKYKTGKIIKKLPNQQWRYWCLESPEFPDRDHIASQVCKNNLSFWHWCSYQHGPAYEGFLLFKYSFILCQGDAGCFIQKQLVLCNLYDKLWPSWFTKSSSKIDRKLYFSWNKVPWGTQEAAGNIRNDSCKRRETGFLWKMPCSVDAPNNDLKIQSKKTFTLTLGSSTPSWGIARLVAGSNDLVTVSDEGHYRGCLFQEELLIAKLRLRN